MINIKELINWLNTNLKEVIEDLNEPATIEQIQILESKIDIQFPNSFKELYLLHNGQKSKINTGLFYGLTFLSLENIEQHWLDWLNIINESSEEEMNNLSIFCESNPKDTIKKIYANKKWIPFAYDWGGNYLGLDFNPEEKGNIGQIINFGRDEDKKFIIAKSFEEFITWFVKQLEQGNFNIVKEDDGGKSFNTKIPTTYHFLDSIKELFKV